MSDPLTIWLEKKLYLEQQLAITSDPSQKFALREQIKECEQEIARLQNQPSKSTLKNNIPKRNRFFIGREKILNQLSELFTKNKAVAIEQAVSGLGGMGKTQTAIEFCYRHINDYQTILWVKAEHQTDLNNSYSELTTLLELIQVGNSQELKNDQIIDLVKNWLINNSNWFMVLDNLEDPALLKNYLPNNHKGHILITTRAHSLGQLAKTIKLEKMDSYIGSLFLLRRAELLQENGSLDEVGNNNKKLANELVTAMDGLPLALDQAGAYIENTNSTLENYLQLYKDAKHAAKLSNKRGKNTDDHISVTATFSLAFDKVKEKSSITAKVLQACSFLSSDFIPEEIFTQSANLLDDELSTLANDPLAWDEVIEVLLGYSLIERDANNKSISVHRLVQAVIRELMDDSTKNIYFENLVNALGYLFPDDAEDPNNWPKYQRLLTSVSALFEIDNTYNFLVSKAATLFHQFGIYCDTQALFTQSFSFYNQSLAICKQHFGINHPDVAFILDNIASVYYQQGKYSEALACYNQALGIKKQHFGNDHPSIASTLNNIAIVYKAQGKYSEALDLFHQSSAIYKHHFGNDHPDVANTLNNIANIYRQQGKYSEALNFFNQSLAIKKQHFGNNHPSVASTLNNIGEVYRQQEKYSEALARYNQALDIYKQHFGNDHPDAASTLNNIAIVYKAQGKYSEALGFFNQSLAIDKQHFGINHPSVASTLKNTAIVYHQQGKYSEALEHYNQALSIYDKFLPSNHPDIISLLKAYSVLLLQLHRNDEAKPLLERLSSLEKLSE